MRMIDSITLLGDEIDADAFVRRPSVVFAHDGIELFAITVSFIEGSYQHEPAQFSSVLLNVLLITLTASRATSMYRP
jgi:hypothetical protein